MRDKLDGVSVFVEAVEAGGFAKAADRLALTRSAVGKTIARLEDRLGVRLFHRTTRSQHLTDDGQVYYEHCLRALKEIHEGEASLESGQHEVSGKLKISMPLLIGRHCIEPLLLELAERHPRLALDLRFGDTLVDLIRDGFDLVIRNKTPGDGDGLTTRRVASQKSIVCAAPSYLAVHGIPTTIAHLIEHDALVYWQNDHAVPWTFLDGNSQPVHAELKWRLQFDSQEAIADAAVRGMGVAKLLSWLVKDHLDTGRLVALPMDHFPTAMLDTYLVWPTNKQIPMRLRAAIDLLVEKLPTLIDA